MPGKKESKPREFVLIIDGKTATDAEYKRFVNAPACKANRKDRATAPIETVSRAFRLMR